MPEEVVATGVNPAVFEISGHLLYKQEEDYERCTQDAAQRMLECASLTEEDFLETVAHILDEEEPAPLPEGYRALDLSRGRLETIRGSFDGVSEVEVTTADVPALKASVSVSPTCAS